MSDLSKILVGSGNIWYRCIDFPPFCSNLVEINLHIPWVCPSCWHNEHQWVIGRSSVRTQSGQKQGGPSKTLAFPQPLNYLRWHRGWEAQVHFSSVLRPVAEQVKTSPLGSRSKPHNSLAKVRVTAMLCPARVNQMSLATEVHGNTIK